MKKKHIKWLLVIAWMILRFVYSSQTAVISDENSGFVIKVFKYIGIDLKSSLGDLANFIVRKSAHFTEYFILSLLVYNALRENCSVAKAIFFTITIVFCYACSDEIHQLFVPGREGKFRDVIIDTSGGAAGMLVVYLSHIKNLIDVQKELT